MPTPRPADYQLRAPQLRDTQFQGRKLRLVSLQVTLATGEAILVQVAEPVDARLSLGRSILGNIVIPQFMFINPHRPLIEAGGDRLESRQIVPSVHRDRYGIAGPCVVASVSAVHAEPDGLHPG